VGFLWSCTVVPVVCLAFEYVVCVFVYPRPDLVWRVCDACTNGCVGLVHSCRDHTLSTHGQATGIQKHRPYTHRPNTQAEQQYKIIEIPQQPKNAASMHIGEHHQKSDNKGHEQRKEKCIYLSILNSIQFNFNYNNLIFKMCNSE
jgi:hypothetical protein